MGACKLGKAAGAACGVERPFRPELGLPLCQLERPFSHRRDLAAPVQGWPWRIHLVLGLEDRGVAGSPGEWENKFLTGAGALRTPTLGLALWPLQRRAGLSWGHLILTREWEQHGSLTSPVHVS